MKYSIMKELCMFDLPMETTKEKRIYRKFRKELIKQGFVMMQFSIYIRTCPTREYVKRLEKRISKIVPKDGNVRLLTITEKQFEEMRVLVGNKSLKETAIKDERYVVI